jgi:hypothetical protein
MNARRFVLAGLAGFVAMFLLSLVFHLSVDDFLDAAFSSNMLRPDANIVSVVLGYVVAAFLMAYIYPIGYKSGKPIMEGLRFGLLMGLLITLPVVFDYYGILDLPFAATWVDALYHVVEKIVGGVVIALVYGSGAGAASN